MNNLLSNEEMILGRYSLKTKYEGGAAAAGAEAEVRRTR
jgi:hypothetical protein